MKKKKEIGTKFWCEIVESENLIMVFPDLDCLVAHMEFNGTCIISQVRIKDSRTINRIKRELRKGSVATSVGWNRYCGQFGYYKLGDPNDGRS